MRIMEEVIRETLVNQAYDLVAASERRSRDLKRLAEGLSTNAAPQVTLEDAAMFDESDGYTEKRRDFSNVQEVVESLLSGYTAIHGSRDPSDISVKLRVRLKVEEECFDLDEEVLDNLLLSAIERRAAA